MRPLASVPVAPSGTRRWWALGALGLAVLTVGIDGTVLSVALPTLSRALHASESDLQWFSSVDHHERPGAGRFGGDVGGTAVYHLSGRGGRLRRVDLWVFSELSGARTGANGWTGGNCLIAR